jgi:hypothetical protein
LLKITEWQFLFIQLIHKLSEAAEVDVGVAGHVEENVVNCGDA